MKIRAEVEMMQLQAKTHQEMRRATKRSLNGFFSRASGQNVYQQLDLNSWPSDM